MTRESWLTDEADPSESIKPQPKTPDEFARIMQDLFDSMGTEDAHFDADMLMCQVLKDLGYGRGVSIFLRNERWYK